jgi:phytoene synthase
MTDADQLLEDREASTAAAARAASGSSFYAGMRVLPKTEREAMYAVYAFCRAVDDIADDLEGDPEDRRAALTLWRRDLARLYAGQPAGRASLVADAVARFGLAHEDFIAVIDGMQMDLDGPVVAPDAATLDLYVDRVASAVGRLSVRIFGMEREPGIDLAHHLGRALQLTNILRDLDEDALIGRLYLPQNLLGEAGIASRDPAEVIDHPQIGVVCAALAGQARDHYAAADAVMAAATQGRLIAPRLMSVVYAKTLDLTEAAGWAPPRTRPKPSRAAILGLVLRTGLRWGWK